MSKEDEILVKPLEGLKRAYIIPKLHKPDARVKAIVFSLNSITSGAEVFLKGIVKPFLNKCEFSLDSTKFFNEKFLSGRMKFDSKIYEVVSYDVDSLLT